MVSFAIRQKQFWLLWECFVEPLAPSQVTVSSILRTRPNASMSCLFNEDYSHHGWCWTSARLAKLLKRPSRHPVSQSAQVSNVTSGLARKTLTLELSQRLLSQVQDAGKPTFDFGVLGNPRVVHQGSVLQTLLDHLPHFLRRHWGDDVFHQDLHSTQHTGKDVS